MVKTELLLPLLFLLQHSIKAVLTALAGCCRHMAVLLVLKFIAWSAVCLLPSYPFPRQRESHPFAWVQMCGGWCGWGWLLVGGHAVGLRPLRCPYPKQRETNPLTWARAVLGWWFL